MCVMPSGGEIPHMVEWYSQVNKLLGQCKISKADLVTIVATSNTKLRYAALTVMTCHLLIIYKHLLNNIYIYNYMSRNALCRRPCRSGSEEMLEKLDKAGVPVLVFSAGMGDIIVHVLDKFGVNLDNIKIVSNFFKFDEEVRQSLSKHLLLLLIRSAEFE